jgi:hypothetical protein
VTGVVPRAREETVALQPEDLGIGVHTRRKCPSDSNVWIDLEEQVAHAGDASYRIWTPFARVATSSS